MRTINANIKTIIKVKTVGTNNQTGASLCCPAGARLSCLRLTFLCKYHTQRELDW